MNPAQVVRFDRPAPNVARLLIDRPSKRNAIDFDVREQMTQHLRVLLMDKAVRAIVIGGTEHTFSAGGDVPSMIGLDEAGARARMQHIHLLCNLVAHAPVPVVSAIEGIGAGGAVGLALLGDVIVVGEGTKILFPFLGLGLAPDWGQLLTLPRRVGISNARRILSSGRPLSGAEAIRIGLADAIVGDAEVMNTALEGAQELAALPQDAFARMKARLAHPSATLGEELKREEDDQAVCLLGEEFGEGFAAFTEKRKPDFNALPRKVGSTGVPGE